MLSVQRYMELAPFPLTAGDIETLGQTDEEYVPHTWQEVKDVIAAGDMSVLNRAPSDLRNYILWVRETKFKNDTVIGFLLRERLLWETKPVEQAGDPKDTQPSNGLSFEYQDETPFANEADYKILRNDWPYGLTRNIVHLVVWLKTRIPVDEDGQGGPTKESAQLIEDFVFRTFTQEIIKRHQREAGNAPENIADEKVMWFKNKKKWQTVASIEHIHVILRDVDEDLVTGWTGQAPNDITARKYVWNGH